MNGARTLASAWAAPLVVALLLGLSGAGCGYRLAGSNSFLPERIKVIAVLPFENRTVRPEIEQRVTEEISRELSRRGSYSVITDPDRADATLEGAIVGYSTSNVELGSGGRATRMEAVVVLQATLRERQDDAVLWSQSGLVFREQFDVPDSGDFVDQETVALDEIARGAAGALVTSILEGF